MAVRAAGRGVAAAFLGGLVAVAGAGLVGTAIHAGSPASVLDPAARPRPPRRVPPAVPAVAPRPDAPARFPGAAPAAVGVHDAGDVEGAVVAVAYSPDEGATDDAAVVPLVEPKPATEPRGLLAGDRAPDGDALETIGSGVPQLDGPGDHRRGPIATWIRDSFEEMRASRGSVVPFPQRQATAGNGRLIDRIRSGERILGRDRGDTKGPHEQARARGWPAPATLLEQLEQVAKTEPAPSSGWATDTLALVRRVAATEGPGDADAAAALEAFRTAITSGLALADAAAAKGDSGGAANLRRAVLAARRREAVWSAAIPAAGGADDAPTESSAERVADLLARLERYESSPTPAEGAAIVAVLSGLESGGAPAAALAAAVREQYIAANVRVAIHQKFVERVLPPTQVTSAPVDDTVLGRQVRGTSRVEQRTAVRFTPDADGISVLLEVRGQVASRTVTETGPVALVSKGNSSFTVRKPVSLDDGGLSLGKSRGSASSRSQLADIQTTFDGVPIMRSLVRNIARNQHEEHLPEANREVIDKIVSRACREVDQQVEPRLVEAAERIRTQAWGPLVRLGLEPTPVNLETSGGIAMARLRLAADDQLAAFTPRPRAPLGSMLSLQVHESAINNALERLDLAGRRLPLEDLVHLLCDRAGVDRRSPDDLPEDVVVGFAASQPLRVQYRDGLVHIRVALDSLESGRRQWNDIVASVSYRPKAADPQLFLEREGPVHIGGAGRQGRAEIALRAVFGKIFPKERPLPLLPEAFVEDPKLADLKVLQATATDGWMAISLGESPTPAERPAAAGKVASPQHSGPRRTKRR